MRNRITFHHDLRPPSDLLEDRRRAAEARRRQLVEATGEGIWLLDELGRTRFVNPAAAHLIGRAAGELLGRPPSTVLDAGAARCLASLLAGEQTGRCDVDVTTPAGTRRSLRVTVTPLRDDPGGRTGTVLSLTDMTELARARAGKAELEERLRRAEKVEGIGLLTSQVAHDFNNVLSAILSTTELALRTLEPDDPAAGHLRRIAEGARLAVNISRRLLSYGRSERDEPLVVDLGALVSSTLATLRDAVPAGVAVREELAPDTRVRADPVQIRQLVMNLVDNAVDATAPAGEVVVPTSEERIEGRRRAVLEVCDTGSGDTPAGHTVLVVEDDPVVRDLTQRILLQHGFEVVQAADGEEALALAGRADVQFDVVLTDQTMPGMSGLALLQALRDAGHGAPGIVMSGYAAGPALHEGGTPPSAWLHKPFGSEALVSALQAALRTRA